MRKQIPNIITLFNLFFGIWAIVFCFQYGTVASMSISGDVLIEIPEKLFFASLCIGIASIVDFFDGYIARLLKVPSEMGKQLDSLADIVSFGVAPACIVFQFLRMSLANDVNALSQHSVLLAPAFLIPMAGAYRLARFNLDNEQSSYFKGVPIPMIGILTAAFPLIYWQASIGVLSKLLLNPLFWYGYIIIVSYLMIMKTPMMALKGLSKKKPLLYAILFIVLDVMITAIFYQWYAIPFGFIGYCLVSLYFSKTITQ